MNCNRTRDLDMLTVSVRVRGEHDRAREWQRQLTQINVFAELSDIELTCSS